LLSRVRARFRRRRGRLRKRMGGAVSVALSQRATREVVCVVLSAVGCAFVLRDNKS